MSVVHEGWICYNLEDNHAHTRREISKDVDIANTIYTTIALDMSADVGYLHISIA